MEEKTYQIPLDVDDILTLYEACTLLNAAHTGRGHAIVNYLPIDETYRYQLGIDINKHIATALPGGVDGYTSTLPIGHPENPFNDSAEQLRDRFKCIIDDIAKKTKELF